MPSFAPRSQPIRKKTQLLNSSEDLRLAILHQKPSGRIKKLAQRYRAANLSYIKAKIHYQNELEYQHKKPRFDLKKLEDLESIIEEFK